MFIEKNAETDRFLPLFPLLPFNDTVMTLTDLNRFLTESFKGNILTIMYVRVGIGSHSVFNEGERNKTVDKILFLSVLMQHDVSIRLYKPI
jgi:hypothetical protein